MAPEGYIVRETEKAVAYVAHGQHLDPQARPLWVPRSKIVRMTELDVPSKPIRLMGEKVARQATPVIITIDPEFLKKVQ